MDENFDKENLVGIIAPVTRQGERLAGVEKDVLQLKIDMEHVRTSLHEIRGNQQLSLVNERKVNEALVSVSDALKIINASLTSQGVKVDALTSYSDQAKGIWWAIVRICAVIVAGGSFLAAMVAGAAWLFEHHVQLIVH